MSVNVNDETADDIDKLKPPAMSGSLVVNNKATVYPLNQVKVPNQLNVITITTTTVSRSQSPGVITSTSKVGAMNVTSVKLPKDPAKTIPSTTVTPILATRIVQKSGTMQQQQSSTPTPAQSKLIVNNAINTIPLPQNSQKLQVTYEALQVTNNQSQQSAVIQSCQPIGKNLTGVTNLQRLPSNAKLITQSGYQKVRTITSGLNNQTGVLQKNVMQSRVQVPKGQLTGQITPINVNQVITAVNNTQRFQTNATITLQKSQTCNQKLNPGNNENQQNHKLQINQIQGQQKTAGTSQKAQTLPRQQQQNQQKQINSVKKIPVGDLQKATIQNNQALNNAQLSASISGNQNRNLSVTTNFVKSDNNCSNNQQLNMTTKSMHSAALAVNKAQVQQIVPQAAQSTQQMMQKQLSNVQQPRAQGNVSIQPKMNVGQQQLANLPVNAKSSAMINAKLQQPQMLLRLEPGKNIGNLPGSVKTTGQKTGNIVNKNSQCLQQNIHRNANAQPVKIIQQNSSTGYQQAQAISQKQPGCIKTIPAQKPQNRNQGQAKSGIKTSLNTNINTLKTIATSGTTVITQKGNIKTILPHQQNASNVIVQKGQQIKIQSSNVQQKQIFLTSQFPQQQVRQQGQIKTILPVTLSATDVRKDAEGKSEADRQIASRDEEENEDDEEEELKAQQSPVRRMPLPYECLQFVLQDHNYGAPPPRTPPPTSPTIKQQPINGGAGPTLPHQSFIYNQGVSISNNTADDAASAISSEPGREVEPEGEETETAPEGEGDEEDSITRCICEFEHDDGYMICCDRCLVWQHVDCMGIDRSNIPDEYLCEICRPRRVDRQRARALQMRKREELLNSDTSSDTSSTTSAETSVAPVVPNQKKRATVQQQARKKPETAPQPRRLNNNNNESSNNNAALSAVSSMNPITTTSNSNSHNENVNSNSVISSNTTNTSNSNTNNANNNNNVTKRPGRREQTSRQTSVQARKKEVPKRGPGKRKAKRRRSTDNDDENQETWGTNMAPLRQWIERYEEAVTNHYSPELRARISSIKVNGTHSDFRQNNNNMSATAIGKCRVNVNNNVKYLMATMYLPQNTPVVELRGKYMLSTQHRPTNHGQGRQHSQRPGPFVFFYRLPREGTEVCVDTRTYGNDARFVRRSCTPNAEVKHCIEKGTLHLYIVTTSPIDKNTEITIKHEHHNLLMSPNSSNTLTNTLLPVSCACGNSRTCQLSSIVVGQQVVTTRRSSSGASADNSDGRERRRRGRKSIVSDDTDASSSTGASTIVSASLPTTSVATIDVSSPGMTGATPKRTVEVRDKSKEEIPQVAQLPPLIEPSVNQVPVQASTSPVDNPPIVESKKDKKKMTREERKMEAIMKAFERLEKAEQRKQEVQARNAQRKESGGAPSDDDHPIVSHTNKNQKHHPERPTRRKRRKGRARTTSSSQQSSHSSRRTRLNSADSDLSSGDDDHSIASPPLRRQQQSSAIGGPSEIYSPSKNDNLSLETSSHQNQVIPTAAGLLLALANSSVPDSSRSMSPTSLQQPAPSKSPTCDSGASSSSQSSTPSTPLSSACLLVAAAVGPLAPGFKFPKTKKAMMNEWLRESPDLTPLPQKNLPIISPTGLISKESPKVVEQLSSDYLNQSINYGNKSLATLVQAANSVSGICDSPPQRKDGNNSCANSHNQQCPVSSGSAKKRWLRQAISEECDSPNSRPESPPNETVAAPPKKRRIARESLSSDNYTPPTTPTPSNADALAALGIADVQSSSINENYQERPILSSSQSHSPLSLEGQIKNYLDCEMKDDELDIKKCDYYENCPVKSNEIIGGTSPIKSENLIDEQEIKFNSITPISPVKIDDKIKFELKSDINDLVKDEPMDTECTQDDDEINLTIKTETKDKYEDTSLNSDDKIVDNVDKIYEKTDDTSSTEATDTESRIEFDNNSTSEQGLSSLPSERKKDDSTEEQEERIDEASRDDPKLDEPMSIDEFDVEAQMKKITGDDGNDYKEKIETSSERDKSFDGIEGLMESSKEDSDTSDREERDDVDTPFDKVKTIDNESKDPVNEREKIEERAFKEFETLASLEVLNSKEAATCDDKKIDTVATTTCSSEESMFDSISNLDCESVAESPKIFQSIPPLSERIRKKTDTATAPKKQLDFEAAIIESTIDMETVELSNGEHKTELSTALRQLLDSKIDDEQTLMSSMNTMANEPSPSPPPLHHVNESTSTSLSGENPNPTVETSPLERKDAVEAVPATPIAPLPSSSASTCPIAQAEVKRLKDPRTATPAERAAPEAPPPVKRKLSISEYRKRKQQSTGGTPPEPSNDASSSDKSPGRGRSDSASSGTSSMSSDDENAKATIDTAAALTSLALFAAPDTEERKGGEEGTIGWSAAPTLVERQRENLTERLKREFGLFLSDDEEERARKQGLTAEAIMKARQMASPTQVPVPGAVAYPPPQLPPQPYIPPPGSAPINYPQLQGKTLPGQPYQTLSIPPQSAYPAVPPIIIPATSSGLSPTGATNQPKSSPQFLVPQAPPGSNPYPPSQFAPTASALSNTTRFTPTTPPPLPPPLPPPPSPHPNFGNLAPTQKSYYTHSHPPARS